jgi:anti-sigma regulatory factor (Ser/Thr protein kinase)
MPEPLRPSPEGRSQASRTFPNDDAALRPLSEWFREFASDNGIAGVRALDFELCLNELVTNVIHYAYADRRDHLIRIALERENEELRATVEDDGRPFNPLEKEPPATPASLEDAGVGGWGIPIVRAFADDLSYERRDGRNRFTIISRERPSSS